MKKPDNILVDFDDKNGKITNFSFVVGDWGVSWRWEKFYGATPMYASPNAFQDSAVKDLFAFGIIAAELYLDQSGKLIIYLKSLFIRT